MEVRNMNTNCVMKIKECTVSEVFGKEGLAKDNFFGKIFKGDEKVSVVKITDEKISNCNYLKLPEFSKEYQETETYRCNYDPETGEIERVERDFSTQDNKEGKEGVVFVYDPSKEKYNEFFQKVKETWQYWSQYLSKS